MNEAETSTTGVREVAKELRRLFDENTTLRSLLQQAVKAVQDFNDEGISGYFIVSTCPTCTLGTVPDKWNEGNCWYHEAERLLKS